MNKHKIRAVSVFCLSCFLLTLLASLESPVSRVGAAAGVQILSHTGYLDSLGYYHVVGEVLNSGDQPLSHVKVTATFYNSSGIVVGTSYTTTTLSILLAGRKSPFDILLFDTAVSPKVHHYSLASARVQALRILSNSSYVDAIGYRHVVGEIKNIGTVNTTYVKVIATFYNTTGGVIASSFIYSDPDDLNANQTAPFDVFIDKYRTPLADHYALTADSIEFAVIPEFPSSVSILLLLLSLSAMLLGFRRSKHPNLYVGRRTTEGTRVIAFPA
jgi:hypothetical protein